MDEPTRPDPLTPAQFRARRATHLAVKRVYQEHGDLAWAAAMPASGPARCAFLEHEVVRCVVTQTDAAREYILTSNQRGRLFPLALGEAFGSVDPDLIIALDVVPRADRDDVLGDDGHLLSVTVLHGSGVVLHTFLHTASHLQHIHPKTRMPSFNPVTAAKELVRLYQLQHGG